MIEIAKIRTGFHSKFGIPRQSGLVPELKGTVVFNPEYRNADALRGLEGFSHIWLIWEFSEAIREDWSPTVRPPRLGGNRRMGVWATRSPFRPNPIGLSCVRLLRIEAGPVLVVQGADLVDGTPILDIKPYLPYADCKPDAVGGFSDRFSSYRLPVTVSEEAKAQADELGIGEEKMSELVEVLSLDPRPAYQNDPKRLYGMSFDGYEVGFFVTEEGIKVSNIRLRSV